MVGSCYYFLFFFERGCCQYVCMCVSRDTCYQVPLPSTGGDCILVFRDPIPQPKTDGDGWMGADRIWFYLLKGGGVGWVYCLYLLIELSEYSTGG